MDRSKQLGEESIGRLLLKFSIPAIIGMLVNALYNIIDRIFVGNGVGDIAIAAIAVAYPVSLIIMGFGMLVGIGAAASVSIKLGQKKKNEAERILGNALTLVVLVSVMVTFFGLIFLQPILIAFGASSDVLPYAKQFTSIILWGAILQNIGFGLNNIIRSEGNPKIAMGTMLIGAILNSIFNPIFIFGLHLGISGSALATIVSQTVCSIWILYYFIRGGSHLKLKRSNLYLKGHIVKQIFAIGLSPFLMQVAASIVTITFNKSLENYGGDVAIAAFGIINAFSMLILMPIFGINQGAQPLIGYNYGSKDYKRVKRALYLACLAATLVSTFGFIIVELFPQVIIEAFIRTNPDIIRIGSQGIRIYLMMLPIIGFQVVSSSYFQAIGKAKVSIFLSLSRQVIILLPLIIILPQHFALVGVWCAAPISDFISSLVSGVFVFKEMKRLY